METASKINIGVIFGGRSGEHDVSLMSSRSVLSVLNPHKYNVVEIGITRTGKWMSGPNAHQAFASGDLSGLYPVVLLPETGDSTLYRRTPSPTGDQLTPVVKLDVVFPVLHGTFGEDGTLQGLLEMSDIAYVGAGVLGSSVGMDKSLFKQVMRANNLPVVDWLTVTRREMEANMQAVLERAEAMCAYPLFVKPANLGSSVGITKCRNRSDLYEGLMDAARFDRRVIIERGVNAREIEVSVLGNDQPAASIAGEIRPRQDFYTYDAKYTDESTELLIPAQLDEPTMRRVQDLAVAAFSACDISGLARVDFLVDRDSGEVFIGEINTIPGFTRISMYPKLWEASGIPYADLVDRLVQLGLERKRDRDQTVRDFRSSK